MYLNYSLLSLICLIAMLSPGPDFVLIMRNSLEYPRRQAFATALGVVCGCCVHAVYCVTGLALLITRYVFLYSTIKYAGASYLIYLGVRGLFSKTLHPTLVPKESNRNIDTKAAFSEGLLCNLLNPKLAVFLLSLFTQFVAPDANMLEKAWVALVFVAEATVYWPVLVLILRSAIVVTFFCNFQSALNRAFGSTLLILGIKVALT